MQYQEIKLREDGTASLCAYVLDPAISFGKYKTRPAMVVCPGGAYLEIEPKEGEAVAARWLGMGYQVFVLRYKHYCKTHLGEVGTAPIIDEDSCVPEQLVDLMAAMRVVHEHAQEWDIDERRIYVMGFSAGAHLVGSLAERFDEAELLARAGATAEQAKPAATIMGYPMISASPLFRLVDEFSEQMPGMRHMLSRGIFGCDEPTQEQEDAIDLALHVRPDMPRLFVWQPGEDVVVSPLETVRFMANAVAAGVPCEFHLFQRGPHGVSLGDESSAAIDEDVQPEAAEWVAACKRWLDLDAPTGEYCHQ